MSSYKLLIFFSLFFTSFIYYSRVDNSLTNSDIAEIKNFLTLIPELPENASAEQEIKYIISVQSKVLQLVYGNDGIPQGQTREVADVLSRQSGLCFDRSRILEKILRYSGFETRHVSLYSTDGSFFGPFNLLYKKGINSHAVSEVKTKDGWLLIGSNYGWISLDKNRKPVSIKEMKKIVDQGLRVEWYEPPTSDIYVKPFIFFYGLYSRHGMFYPPFNFFPDINYSEFMYNFI